MPIQGQPQGVQRLAISLMLGSLGYPIHADAAAPSVVGELISGDVGIYQLKRWTKGREKAIEEAFVKDEDTTDLKPWLWNGPGDPMHPGDLGYWVGYRIAKSYYDRSNDKPSSIKDIIAVSNAADARALLAASGWRPAR